MEVYMDRTNNIGAEPVPTPVLVSFGITRECDLKCLHCYSDSGQKDPGELSTFEAKNVIDDVAEMGARLIILDGGEPTLRKDLTELIGYCRSKGLKTVIGSHGMSLTKELVRDLKRAGCQGVAISLDGAKAETHDEWRGIPGAWSRTIQGARICSEMGLPFQLAPMLQRGNWEQLRSIADLARQLKADALEIFDFVPTGRGKEHAEYELTAEQRKQIIEEVIGLQRMDDLTYRLIALPQYWAVVEKTVPEDEILMKFVRSCCAAGTRYITILPNGDVIPCMVLQVILGNVHKERLIDIWRQSPVLKMLRNRDNLKGKCGICRYKRTCAGARCKAYEKTGDFLAEDPTCWFSENEIREDA
jgi:radical SAM protein with 4Fe4S-binding SPASM domain